MEQDAMDLGPRFRPTPASSVSETLEEKWQGWLDGKFKGDVLAFVEWISNAPKYHYEPDHSQLRDWVEGKMQGMPEFEQDEILGILSSIRRS